MKLKTITINGRTFQYKKKQFGENVWTNFYEGTELKFRLFKFKKVEVPKVAFTIYHDFNNPSLTKEWWRSEIEKQLILLNREEQIERGELI